MKGAIVAVLLWLIAAGSWATDDLCVVKKWLEEEGYVTGPKVPPAINDRTVLLYRTPKGIEIYGRSGNPLLDLGALTSAEEGLMNLRQRQVDAAFRAQWPKPPVPDGVGAARVTMHPVNLRGVTEVQAIAETRAALALGRSGTLFGTRNFGAMAAEFGGAALGGLKAGVIALVTGTAIDAVEQACGGEGAAERHRKLVERVVRDGIKFDLQSSAGHHCGPGLSWSVSQGGLCVPDVVETGDSLDCKAMGMVVGEDGSCVQPPPSGIVCTPPAKPSADGRHCVQQTDPTGPNQPPGVGGRPTDHTTGWMLWLLMCQDALWDLAMCHGG